MTGTRRVVVVGVDGSPNSVVALRRGAAEAAKDGARLRAVHVRRATDSGGGGVLEGAAAERVGGVQDVLLKEAVDADVLVVGAHGQTGAFRAVLGTTARSCADHAQCAVLVVPPNVVVVPPD